GGHELPRYGDRGRHLVHRLGGDRSTAGHAIRSIRIPARRGGRGRLASHRNAVPAEVRLQGAALTLFGVCIKMVVRTFEYYELWVLGFCFCFSPPAFWRRRRRERCLSKNSLSFSVPRSS